MNKLEKAIRGLECSIEHINQFGDCAAKDCPYSKDTIDCHEALMRDVLELLKAREPRILSLEEVLADYPMCWFENRATHSGCFCQPMPAIDYSEREVIDIMVFGSGTQNIALQNQYNITWRCWTQEPTDEQIRKEPWKS